MGVSNGQPVDEDFTNPAFVDRRQDDTMFGVYTLDNTTDPNSGAQIVNFQQFINDLIQSGKLFVYTTTHSKLTWSGTQLSFSEDIKISSKDFSVINTILAANSPLSIADGESIYITLSRYASANCTPVVSSVLPKGKDIFRLATRVGTALIFWDNTFAAAASSFRIGQGGGVTSLGIYGDLTALDGAVELEQGVGVTLTRTGQRIRIDASGGSGSGPSTDANGNTSVMLKPEISPNLVMQSPDTTYWTLTIANDGTLTATPGGGGPVSNLKFTKPDSSQASLAITNAGDIEVVSPPPGGETLDDNYFIQSPDGNAWRFAVTNLNELQIESDTSGSNYFDIKNDVGQELFKVQEVGGLAIHYIPVFSASNLPATPSVVSGCLPWAMYDSGTFKRPIYHDGTSWKYFHDNSAV